MTRTKEIIIDTLLVIILFSIPLFVVLITNKSVEGIKTNKLIKPKIIIKTTNTNGIVVSDTTYVYKVK